MIIDDSTLDNLATLARIRLSAEDRVHRLRDLDQILAYVGQLQSVALTGKGASYIAVENVVRPDDVVAFAPEVLRAQFPDRETDYLKVPQVLKK